MCKKRTRRASGGFASFEKQRKVAALSGLMFQRASPIGKSLAAIMSRKGEWKMSGISVDRYKNESRGKRGTAKESLYFGAIGSKSNLYEVTLNYDTGHWCSCRGMTSKVRKYGAVGGLDPRNPLHWCKHVNTTRSPSAFELRVEARRIRNETFGIHEIPSDPETGRTIDDVPSPGSNRRRAIAGTKAKNGSSAAQDRLDEIEREREALLREIAAQESPISKAVAALVSEHGQKAVEDALGKAS